MVCIIKLNYGMAYMVCTIKPSCNEAEVRDVSRTGYSSINMGLCFRISEGEKFTMLSESHLMWGCGELGMLITILVGSAPRSTHSEKRTTELPPTNEQAYTEANF
jgi:hypothetical protein